MKRITVTLAAALLAAAPFAREVGAADPIVLKTLEFGHGPTVVLLHGVGSGRMVWMPTAKKLLAGYHVVLVDLPGHGDSPLPDPFSLEAAAEAVDGVIAKQKADSTILVGQSMGGMLAMMVAQAHPDHLKGVLVIDAAAKSTMSIPDQQQQYFIQALDDRYADVMKMFTSRQGRDSTQSAEIYAMVMQAPPASVKAYIKASLRADASGALKTMKPAFEFVGSERLYPAGKSWTALSKELGYEGVDSLLTRRIAGSGPLIMKEQPDSLAAVIADFTTRAIAAKKK